MGLESGTYIDDLVATNPTGTDVVSKGDDHIRLIKSTIKASFPDVDDAVMTIHNGTSAPANKQTGTIFRDEANSLWKFWNGSAWITLAIAFNTSNSVDVNAGTIDGVTIGGSSAPTVTNLGSVATCDINGGTIDGVTIGAASAPTVTNIDINGGSVDAVTVGTNSPVTELQVDNINVNGNAITSTDSNGDLTITPNGTGEIVLDGQKWPQADGSNTNYLTTNGSGQLAWTTNTVPTSEANAATSATNAATSATSAETAKTAAETAKTAAETAQTSCEAVLDTFDDAYLGSKSSAPTVDNDGDALADGALYFNTTSNVMFVYDLGSTTWLQLQPTDAEQANINIVAGELVYEEDLGSIADALTSTSGNNISDVADDIANVNTVAGQISPTNNISTLAGISGNITTCAGISSNITSVANNEANVNRYADEYTIASSTPSSPSEGDLWYDSTNNVLKYYTGSVFSSISAGISDVVSDTSPQLGGALDCQNNNVSNCGTIDGTNLQIDFGSIA